MTTERQIKANRENARRSTGPKTEDGKAVVALNAVKHGLLSEQALLPLENEDELSEFGRAFRLQLAPEGELEHLLADRAISCAWRLRRAIGAETAMIADGFGETVADAFKGFSGRNLERLSRYETMIERSLFRALSELQRLQGERLTIDVGQGG